MQLITFGDAEAVTLHSAITTLAKPTGSAGGDYAAKFRGSRGTPPDVLIRFLGASAWTFDKQASIFGQLADGSWDRAEIPLNGGSLISGLAGVGQTFAVVMGGYKRLAVGAFDGTTLTASQTISIYAFPAYSRSR